MTQPPVKGDTPDHQSASERQVSGAKRRSRVLGPLFLGSLFVATQTAAVEQYSRQYSEQSLSGSNREEDRVTIPQEYGKLISVVESNGIHYLYFQDMEGNIRIFMLGIKGSTSRARADLEALPHSIYKIQRSKNPPEPEK